MSGKLTRMYHIFQFLTDESKIHTNSLLKISKRLENLVSMDMKFAEITTLIGDVKTQFSVCLW